MRRGGYVFFVIGLVVLATVAMLVFLMRPEADPASREALEEQIRSLELPMTMVPLDEHYTADCPDDPVPCPTLVRWYGLTEPVETVKPRVMAQLHTAGLESIKDLAAVNIISGTRGEHIFFVVLDETRIARDNKFAPGGTKAEVAVSHSDLLGRDE